MPTASTAQILGNNEAIEPYTSNIYLRRVLSGEFQVLLSSLLSLSLPSPSLHGCIKCCHGAAKFTLSAAMPHSVSLSLSFPPLSITLSIPPLSLPNSCQSNRCSCYSKNLQVINHHLLKDLTEMGVWNSDIKQQMIADNGSIQRFVTFCFFPIIINFKVIET